MTDPQPADAVSKEHAVMIRCIKDGIAALHDAQSQLLVDVVSALPDRAKMPAVKILWKEENEAVAKLIASHFANHLAEVSEPWM